MPALYLTEDDVVWLGDMPMAIEAVENAFAQLAEEKAVNVPRVRVAAPGVMLHSMCASAEYLGYVGWKAYTTTRRGARFHVALYDAASGEMVALMEGDHLGRLRTGAASGVATEYMARPDARIVGLFGTGRQGRTQLQAVCEVRRIERVEVYGRDEARRHEFAEEMEELCRTRVVPVAIPDQAATEKDIIICATSSKAPVFDGKLIDEGTHLNVVGSNFLTMAEIDDTTVRRADIIVCDNIEQCKLEAGDFAAALEQGATDWRLMRELADVVAERETGRATAENVTLFKSVGLAIEDVALAVRLLEKARTEGVGTQLPF